MINTVRPNKAMRRKENEEERPLTSRWREPELCPDRVEKNDEGRNHESYDPPSGRQHDEG